jgi:hypothetical protein
VSAIQRAALIALGADLQFGEAASPGGLFHFVSPELRFDGVVERKFD